MKVRGNGTQLASDGAQAVSLSSSFRDKLKALDHSGEFLEGRVVKVARQPCSLLLGGSDRGSVAHVREQQAIKRSAYSAAKRRIYADQYCQADPYIDRLDIADHQQQDGEGQERANQGDVHSSDPGRQHSGRSDDARLIGEDVSDCGDDSHQLKRIDAGECLCTAVPRPEPAERRDAEHADASNSHRRGP